jgi:adenosylcobinamide-GDP ribazoletransferase
LTGAQRAGLALSFLTRIPVPLGETLPEGALAASMGFFPLVGALIGLSIGVVYALAHLALPVLPSAFLALAFGLLLTGALHEDGLADCADGMGGGRDKDAKLAIMRDSRIGSYGGLALLISVGLRAAILGELGDDEAVIAALIIAHSLSRAALPVMMGLMAPASTQGLAASAGRPGKMVMISALVIGILPLALTRSLDIALTILAIVPVAGLIFARIAKRQIGGYNGDCLGALEQIVEITALLVFLATRP